MKAAVILSVSALVENRKIPNMYRQQWDLSAEFHSSRDDSFGLLAGLR